MRRLPASIAAVLAVLALAAGCGGSGDGDAEEATGGTTTAETGGESGLADLLPPEDAVPGLQPGEVREVPSAGEMVDALYQAQDPGKEDAESRLEDAGYEEGVLRDQPGADPSEGLRLFRTYAMRLRDGEAARAEADAAIEEIAEGGGDPVDEVDVPGAPAARAVALEITGEGTDADVLFVSLARGPHVLGFQAFALDDAAVPRGAVFDAVRAADGEAGAAS